MTDIGYSMLIERIRHSSLEVPDELTVDQLTQWLNGAAYMQELVISIIKSCNTEH